MKSTPRSDGQQHSKVTLQLPASQDRRGDDSSSGRCTQAVYVACGVPRCAVLWQQRTSCLAGTRRSLPHHTRITRQSTIQSSGVTAARSCTLVEY